MKRYIVLIGKTASGKDVFAKYLKDKYDIPSVRFSDAIFQVAKEQGLVTNEEASKEKLQELGNVLRARIGEFFYTGYVIEKAREVNGDFCVINGLRHQGELHYLEKRLPNSLILAGIVSDKEKRFERAKGIGMVSTKDDFEKLEDNEAEKNIDALLEKVRFKIENNNGLKEFCKRIDNLLKELDIR